MILKKPYAFIIKHFRIIHLLLIIPMLYLITKTKGIVTFFSDYIANGYMLSSDYVLSNLASNYINIWMYLSVIFILVVTIFLSIVLQKKDKPTKYYNSCIIYYIGMLLIITACFSFFQMIETDTLDDVVARIIRDLSYIIHYSEYFFLIFTFVRGIGFNIKKFNFKNDLTDLEISNEDSEEFEFLVGTDPYKAKRTIRRFFRELRYYYLENKFIFSVIGIVLAIVIGTLIYMNREVYMREYNEQDTISFGYLTFNIKDSFITTLTYNGDVLNKDKAYLVMRVELNNRYREDKGFSYSDLQLVVNKEYITPNISLGNYFKDFGNPYNGSNIKGNTSNTYLLVYEIDKYLVNSKFYISAYSGFDASPGGIGVISKKIHISPSIQKDNVIKNTVGLGTNMSFKNTNVGNSLANISGYEITNRFTYITKYCYTKDNCYDLSKIITYDEDNKPLVISRKTLLILDFDLILDDSSRYMSTPKSYQTFFEDYLMITYTVNGKTIQTKAKVINPNNYNDKLIIPISKDIEYAGSIVVTLTVRNISYTINLK